MKCYTGIGSRSTPEGVLSFITTAALALRSSGYTLRSGHAEGADQAFEKGAAQEAEVYLPWPTFNDKVKIKADAIYGTPTHDAFSMTKRTHPGWASLSQGARCLHSRNAHQVLGRDLQSPSKFVICWTPDGSLDGSGYNTGGTGQALRIAALNNVPVFNLALPEHWARIAAWIKELGGVP